MIDLPPKESVLRRVLTLFLEFGDVSNLRCSAVESELLALEQPKGERIQGVTVVHKTKFLGVLGGDLKEGEEYNESMNKIRYKCKKIGGLALPLGIKIRLMHQWVYPALYNVASVIVMPKKVLVQPKKYVHMALNVTSLPVSLVGLGKSLAGGGWELISPELYCCWAHIQPRARCLSGQATIAENKDLKPVLRAFCDSEGIPCTALAIKHTVLAPGTVRTEGILVRSLWSYWTLQKTLNRVRLTVGQLWNLGLAHSVTLAESLRFHKWQRWATIVGEVNNVDVPSMVCVVGTVHRSHVQQALDTVIGLLDAPNEQSVCIDGSVPPGFEEWRLKGVKQAWFAEMASTDRQSQHVWPSLWKTNLPVSTHKFMYRVPWKKLQVPQQVHLVKGCAWCGA